MRNQSFNKKLYKNMVKQLQPIGILLSIISIITTLVPLIFEQLNSQRYEQYYRMFDIAEIAPVLLVISYAGSLILIYRAFMHVNQRNASDFYDSLPNTRIGRFNSLALAALTWIAITIITTILSIMMLKLIMGMNVTMVQLSYLLIDNLVIALFSMTSALIAISITGTLFTNLMVTGLVVFLPGFLSFMFVESILNAANILTLDSFPLWILPDANIAVAIPFSVMRNISTNYILMKPSYLMSGLIYSTIYFAIALNLFHRRPSETATNSASVKSLRPLYRIGLTIPFLIPATIVGIEGSIIFIIMALTVSLAFELITTRKGKQMLKSLPSFALVVALAFGFSYATKGIAKGMVNQIPQRSEIESVCIETSGHDYGSISYLKYLTKDIQFDDEQMIDTALKALNKNIERIEDDQRMNDESYSYDITYNLRDNKKVVRKLEVNRADSELFYESMRKNPIYRRQLYNVPSIDLIEQGNLHIGNLKKDEAKKRVYAIYQQEMSEFEKGKISAEARETMDQQRITTVGDLVWPIQVKDPEAMTMKSPKPDTMLTNIWCEGRMKQQSFSYNHAIGKHFPKTVEAYVREINAEFKTSNFNMNKGESMYLDYVMFDYGDNGLLEDLDQSTIEKMRYLYKENDKDQQALNHKVWNILYNGTVETVDIMKPLAQVTINKENTGVNDTKPYTATVIVQLTEDMLNKLKKTMEE